jgi:cytochrome c-type biogenesis protein
MEKLFTTLTHAVDGTPLVALLAATLWGVMSILLSPCHLASIPLIVGFIDDQEETTIARSFWASLLFSSGILVTIALIGVLTAAAGRIMGDIGGYGNYIVAVIFFAVGLHLLGVIPMPWSGCGQQVGVRRKGLLAAFLLGLIFGIALGPCSFAYMAPMLAVSFKLGAEQPIYAGSLLLMYGIGHCAVIVLAGTFAVVVQRYKNWNSHSHATVIIKRICGVLVILGGLYMLYTAK